MTTSRQIGHLIIDEIIKQRMVHSEADSDGRITWAANAPEQLEALVEQHYIAKSSHEQMETVATNLMTDLKYYDRLSELSHRELINEATSMGLGSNLIVLELMNRVLPGWEK